MIDKKKYSVLISEDELLIAQDIKSCLLNLGYSVSCITSNGKDTLQKAKEFNPDIALLDIRLDGEFDGIEIGNQLSNNLDIPIIYITAYTDDETIERAKKSKPFGYISKPFDEQDINTSIEIALFKHEAERKLQQSEQKFRILADFTYDWEYWIDPGDKPVYITPSCERITGYTADEFYRDPTLFRKIIHSTDRKIYDDHVRDFHPSLDPVTMIFRIFTKDHKLKWIEHICSSVYGRNGEYLGIRVSNRDITRRKNEEIARKRVEEKLHRLKKIDSLSDMAGGIAHDFNNILQGIIGNASLIKMEMQDDENLSYSAIQLLENIDQIHASADKAVTLTSQMLAFSGHGGLVIRSINVNDILRELIPSLKNTVRQSIDISMELGEIPEVNADPNQIEQVIIELVKNADEAIKSASGNITIKTSSRYCNEDYLQDITINDVVNEGEFVEIKVCDDGEGMDPTMKEKIFDPFFSTKFTGRGLGLSVILGIVRGHRGAIRVKSSIKHGTCFKILLPITGSHVSKRIIKAVEKPVQFEGTSLIVDDDAAVRRVARKMMELNGFSVIEAANGKEAIQIFKDNPNQISIILLDVTMPEMGGKEAFKKIRSINEKQDIILCSGYTIEDISQDFGDSDFDFLQKPYTPSLLIQKIKEIFER